ncbi:MAG: sodium/proton-translocating pyrophosphatase, partial [Oscillospiraceae bacterium]
PLTYFILGKEHMGVYVAILAGLVAGCAIGYFTEYYTSDTYKPTRELADSTETGAATTIIGKRVGAGELEEAYREGRAITLWTPLISLFFSG